MPHRHYFLHIIDKPTAKKAGLKKYFTGKPCKRGHFAQRYADGPCTECAAMSVISWQSRNSDKVRETKRMYYWRNPDKAKASVKRWKAANMDVVRKICREWTRRNLEAKRAYSAKRRSMKTAAGGEFTRLDVFLILLSQNGTCPGCSKDLLDSYHLDHIKPISKGGTSNPSNIQALCPGCNMSKGSRDNDEWLSSRRKKN